MGRVRATFICWPCTEERAWAANEYRATWINSDGVVVRRCSRCREVKPLDTEHFYFKGKVCENSRHPATGPCKICHDAITAIWRAKHPEKVRAIWRQAGRRRYEKMKSDPVLHAQQREDERLARHLKAEQEGRRLRKVKPTIQQPSERRWLPSEPLVAWIETKIENERSFNRLTGIGDDNRNAGPVGEVCAALKIGERDLRRWRAGERVNLDVAERVLLNAGASWAEVWPPDEYPSVYVGLLAGELA